MLDFDSGSARPHPKHRYYVIEYLANKDQDIQITGKIFNSQVKFWTFCVYDEYGLPLLETYDCETIMPSKRKNEEAQAKGKGATEYTVTLTTCPTQPIASYPGNSVDVRPAPTGIVLIRVIYPENEEVFLNSKPIVKLVSPPPANNENDDKKQK